MTAVALRAILVRIPIVAKILFLIILLATALVRIMGTLIERAPYVVAG
jgi:hypothetical protein